MRILDNFLPRTYHLALTPQVLHTLEKVHNGRDTSATLRPRN